MTNNIISLLDRADYASTRAEGQPWAAMRTEDVDAMATTIRKLQGRIMELENAQMLCSCCQEALTFDVCKHLSAPSRLNPLASAAAVNARKE